MDIIRSIWCNDFLVDGDDIWFVSGNIACLIKYNILQDKSDVMGVLPVDTICQENAYPYIRKLGKKFFIFPMWGHEIIEYDIYTGKFSVLEFDGCDRHITYFSNVFYNGNELVGIPQQYDRVVSVNEKAEIKYKYHLGKDVKKIMNNNNAYINSCCRLDDDIVIGMTGTNVIFRYSLRNDTVEYVEIGNDDAKYRMIGSSGDKIYLYDPYTREISIANSSTYKIENEINLSEKYGHIVLRKMPNEAIMLDSFTTPIIGIMDASDNIVCEFDESDDIPCKYTYCTGVYKEDKGLYYNRNTCKMYSVKNMRFEELYSFELSDEQLRKIPEGIHDRPILVKESTIIDLKAFLDMTLKSAK